MTNPVETYFEELRNIRLTGAETKETSYYGPLANLLNGISKAAKLKVQCVINLKNQGAGLPDGGFFTTDQIKRGVTPDTVFDQIPSRGAMEVKSTRDNVEQIAESKQVRDYLDRYGLVLVTNYRDFLLVQRGENNEPRLLEGYTIAETEPEFWSAVNHPRTMAGKHEERLTQFLIRVMLQNAPLTEPKDLAWFLASYARQARIRVEQASELTALKTLRTALEEALGVKFEGEKGDHFFRSTLVQTLFYGLFSAWVLWARDRKERFDWHAAAWLLHVPMISALFSQLATRDRLGPLGLEEVMDWAADALNRVDKDVFFAKFEQEHAVQYFYEPFLEAFDPELRKELGVWYTPPEVVRYMVERVDTVLREELDIADGLADPNVYVLDPCCGTGAYLVEVLRRIERTLRDKGEDALVGSDVKKAATTRVFGFEIMPAPFVVAHLQLGLALKNLHAPLSDEANERAGVYLTNALTGWEPPKEPKTHLPFHEMEIERDLADEVKQDVPILVILGNPPYNAFAGVSPKEEQGLVEPYKEGLISKWGIKKFNLDDLYVRFFRLAEQRIAERTGRGVVCFVSNFSYLRDPSCVVMRQRLLNSFDRLWLDCMNGDSRETGKLTPEGNPDPSVFSTEYNREGIRVGTTIGLFVRKSAPASEPVVLFRQFWGANKRADLIDALSEGSASPNYRRAIPSASNRFLLRPQNIASCYLEWPGVDELPCAPPSLGILENRKEALIGITEEPLRSRMRDYCDPAVDWTMFAAQDSGLSRDAARFVARDARAKLLRAGGAARCDFRRVLVRPMDARWCCYTSVRPVWNEPRPAYARQCWRGNLSLVTRRKGVGEPEGVPFLLSSTVGYQHAMHKDGYFIPMQLRVTEAETNDGNSLAIWDTDAPTASANLSASARAYLGTLGIADPDADAQTAGLIWMHSLALGYSPAYLSENADGIRQDWPRIPLPNSREALLDSAELGRKIAALLDTETEVPGVTSGTIRPELREIAVITSVDGKPLNPDAGDLEITAGWGHGGKDGVTMPGKGKTDVFRDLRSAGLTLRQAQDADLLHSNPETDALNIYLNDKAYWRNIPRRVWDYHIGGYQVIKKWLSYRESALLGRSLKVEEAREVTNIARRIAAILALEADLDANYERVKADAYAWPGKGRTSP